MSSRLEEIVAGLAAGGEVVESGSFTLDRERALEKLERFQLLESALAAARFVEAAHLLGGIVRAHATPWGVKILLNRVYLDRREAQDLLLYAVAGGRSTRARALAELGVGMLAAARGARRRPALTSTDKDGAYRVSFGANHSAMLTALDDEWKPTSIELVRFFLPIPVRYRDPSDYREFEVLRVLARWATTNVFIEDVRVSLGLPQRYSERFELREPGIRGMIGIRSRSSVSPVMLEFARYADLPEATLHLLSCGIHLGTIPLPDVPVEVCGVLDLDALQKDAAHERAVRNDDFANLMRWYRSKLVDYADVLDTRGQVRLSNIAADLRNP